MNPRYMTIWENCERFNWLVLSDEQMSKRWPFSLLNDEQMSNRVGVKHLPVKRTFQQSKLSPSFVWGLVKYSGWCFVVTSSPYQTTRQTVHNEKW